MDLILTCNLGSVTMIPLSPATAINGGFQRFRHQTQGTSLPFRRFRSMSIVVGAKKRRNSQSDPVLKPSIIEEVSLEDDDVDEDDGDELILDDFEDGGLVEDNDYLEDDYFQEDGEAFVGDGNEGGGISLAGTWWDKEALAIAERVALSFDGDLGIYAFRTLSNFTIQIRIEKLSNKSGSPSMEDIEAFSTTYRAKLDEAEIAGSIPDTISLEVSSPGVERIVRIPQDLDRFKHRPMYVKYALESTDTVPSPPSEHDGIFRLVSYDLEMSCCTWGIADVRVNREKAGKGRPLNKKQRDWRLNTPFDSLLLVRLYSKI